LKLFLMYLGSAEVLSKAKSPNQELRIT
jgi:hypothetical protein